MAKAGGRLPYFGGKSEKSINMTFRLMPEHKLSTILDGCFGSGAVTSDLFSMFKGVRKVGMDKNRAVITMHEMMRDSPYKVLDAICNIEYSRKCYDRGMEILGRHENGEDLDKISVAAYKFAVLYMSRNSMEGVYRDITKYDDYLNGTNYRIYLNRKYGLYKKAAAVISGADKLRDVELVNGDFMEHMEFWEDADTFVYLDVPYPLEGRGITDERKKNTGYATDWTCTEQETFLNKVAEMHDTGKLKCRMMICSNFEEDGKGGLIGLERSSYNQILLKRGFRMVVTEHKYASEPCKTAGGKKRPKAEVVWINYKDIKGVWRNYQYYDYEDLYGTLT